MRQSDESLIPEMTDMHDVTAFHPARHDSTLPRSQGMLVWNVELAIAVPKPLPATAVRSVKPG